MKNFWDELKRVMKNFWGKLKWGFREAFRGEFIGYMIGAAILFGLTSACVAFLGFTAGVVFTMGRCQ